MRRLVVACWAVALTLLCVGPLARAQAPGGGLSPLSPPAAPSPRPPVRGRGGAIDPNPEPEPAPAPVAAPPAAGPGAGIGSPRSRLDPVLFVSEGLDAVVPVVQLKARLAEGLGRELVSLVDARAHDAHSTVWMGLGAYHVVLRVTPPQRAEVWRQIARTELGSDPAATLVKAVLEMFWADSFQRIDSAELQDPFCPPGLICLDARRQFGWPPQPEPEVLDPWDTSYRRFYGWDPFAYPGRYPSSAALTPPYPGRTVHAELEPSPYYRGHPDLSPPGGDPRLHYALSFFSGGGVHKGGAFFRYEFNAARRFRLFDFGLAFIGARGQPEPPTSARRAIAALLARRFMAEDFELDLGASFGTFFATFAEHGVEVRPYLRAMVTFALPLGRLFDMLVRSDLATTFAPVPETGSVEYSLSLGLRHRM